MQANAIFEQTKKLWKEVTTILTCIHKVNFDMSFFTFLIHHVIVDEPMMELVSFMFFPNRKLSLSITDQATTRTMVAG